MSLTKIVSQVIEILKIPRARISFKNYDQNTKDNYIKVYNYFTKRHRLKIVRNKTIGVMLIDINAFSAFEEYYKSINGKNSAAYYHRKAINRGYKFIQIDRNDYVDDIYEINTSAEYRQDKKMTNSYLQKIDKFENLSNYKYFGVINQNGKLLSYICLGFYGEFLIYDQLLGHNNFLNDGIMYLMVIELNRLIFNEHQKLTNFNEYKMWKDVRYIMYDTFFGASDGLKMFKKKLGFAPYKVQWIWEK
ncbi:hypothetical protein [Campylobacter gastrosuis]|uniref:BioF2-like acetyltransferase domain-containing protein n=1 Tax=Campylobacter gastrosuis TaxID=2974576 RepID=A0ABT7HN80_9BACT|nr:hypothetical protein [Campylobacter gastrosuis]MDL0088299.1 hypothetical protein [Campylobacter gastrosuis]